MAKIATEYYKTDPWKIIEAGFDESRSMASESVFSLANEYMGVRGFFEEGYKKGSLIGTYFNGIYEVPETIPAGGYRGISKKMHFMVNALNFLSVNIKINGGTVDLSTGEFHSFLRILDMKTGELTRSFVYHKGNVEAKICFSRLLDMVRYRNAFQKIELQSLTEPIDVEIAFDFDYGTVHWGRYQFWEIEEIKKKDTVQVAAKTKQTHLKVISGYKMANSRGFEGETLQQGKKITTAYSFSLNKNEDIRFEKRSVHIVSKTPNASSDALFTMLDQEFDSRTYDQAYESNRSYYRNLWQECDIEIDGDSKNQQGIRFCIFQLMQTYQGIDEKNNIGAKGLTGEAYSGHAFWDTETYCLPFYLFMNPKAAKNLLLFRYNTLSQARNRAKELDCKGACYPIATLNGNEGCDLWQHASLQFQPTTGVAYGIYIYDKLMQDQDFLYRYGAPMLLEISRFLASRGDWNHDRSQFGFYGVMGPDEFQMMVNHNTYTNYMAKRTFAYTLSVLDEYQKNRPADFEAFSKDLNLDLAELTDFQMKAKAMKILFDPKTLLYEQHAGYFDLPHVDINAIPVEEFPLYAHWSYDRIYRNDMIKQPDVLMMMFLYNQSFSFEEKLANYEFYEPRTIHESSLSPSVHSVLAMELGKEAEASRFFNFATRMDLDDYNRNTSEGLHMTSIAAAWMNIIYGFGGVRSDGDILSLAPKIPAGWKQYRFQITYRQSKIACTIHKDEILIQVSKPVSLKVFGKTVTIEDELRMEL